jgi:predicted RNA-binding Zn-ribbon protein involved in translation (DUF1610 family)
MHGDRFDYTKAIYECLHVEGVNTNSILTITCNIHGDFKYAMINHLMVGHGGCRECMRLERQEDFIARAIEVHGNRYNYSLVDYVIGEKSKVTIICPKCGTFEQNCSSHLYGRGCPKCGFSKGELLVSQVLNSMGLTYDYEHTFPDLKSSKDYIIPIDFYIPSLNLCIEYDGEQHYKPYERFGGEDVLKRTQENDATKNEYCAKKGMPLIRIKYTLKDKHSIEAHLKSEISKLKK